jgi:endonuclease/exonuclease/phosphatase (EEP) superfamily protein YafD
MAHSSESYDGEPPSSPADEEFEFPPPPPPPRIKRSAWGYRLALAYLAAVCVLSMTARLVGERFWWTTLLTYIPQVAYAVPGLVILIPILLSRDFRALGIYLGTLLAIAGPVMGWNVPTPSFAPRDAPRVRVLSYNIRGALAGIDLIQAHVREFRPDVVVFSEAKGWSDDEALRQDLARAFPGWSHVEGGDVYIASRWPFASTEALRLGSSITHDPSMDRYKVRAEVEAPFGRFQVVGVHFRTAVYGRTLVKEWKNAPGYLKHTGRIRQEQAQDLLTWTAQIDGPVLLAGDFNTPPAGRIYGAIRKQFGDSFSARGLGWGYTYPSQRSLLRIDYVFHSRDWDTVQCAVGSEVGSDHRPVFAELALRPR